MMQQELERVSTLNTTINDDGALLHDAKEEHVDMGGTMRLGAYPCTILPGTKTLAAYRKKRISERHRHRYEMNITYREQFEQNGLIVSGASPDGKLTEIIELKDHPWFVACQFHPEFKSKPVAAHPLFKNFIRAALKNARNRK